MSTGNPPALKIILVEPRGQGGMIHYAHQMCKALADQGAVITLVTTTQYELDHLPHNFKVVKLLKLWDTSLPNPPIKNQTAALAYKLYRFGRRAIRGIRYIYEWFRLSHFLSKSDADIIQFGKIEFAFEAYFLRWLKNQGKTLTQICHEFELRERSDSTITNIVNQLYNSIYQHFSMLFFHAQDNLERFQTLFDLKKAPMVVIPMGNEEIFLRAGMDQKAALRLRQTYNFPFNSPTALFFGLLAPSKGVSDLISAFSLVHQSNPGARLIIAGAPSKYVNLSEYLDQVKSLALEKIIFFDSRYIPIDEVGALMSLADVVVYPYTSSTQSASLQVAYSFGKPVVVTDTGGLPEAVEAGGSGLIVPQGDIQAMADAILEMLNNPEQTAEMGAYAKHLSETRFSWTNIASKIIAVYSDLT